MNRTTIITLATAALSLTLAAPQAEARRQGRPPGPPPPLAHAIERHADELGLDAATLDSILALQRQARGDNSELRERIQDGRQDLRAMMDSEESDEASVIAQVEALGSLETQARVERMRTDLAIRALLTSEQLATLKSLRPERAQAGERGGHQGRPQAEGRERGDRPQQGSSFRSFR